MSHEEMTWEEIKEQERILFDNTRLNHISSSFSSYPYKSLGQILHWLQAYSVVHVGNVICHGTYITLWDKKMADVSYDEELKIPLFTFTEEYKYYQKNQDVYVKQLRKLYERKKNLITDIVNSQLLILLSTEDLKEVKDNIKQMCWDTVIHKKDIDSNKLINSIF